MHGQNDGIARIPSDNAEFNRKYVYRMAKRLRKRYVDAKKNNENGKEPPICNIQS